MNLNIEAGFRRNGIWPLDSNHLLAKDIMKSSADQNTVMSVDELKKILEIEIAVQRENVIGSDVMLSSCGFIDTRKGAVLTSCESMSIAKLNKKEKMSKH